MALSANDLKELGKWYLMTYGEKPGILHTNQKYAWNLINFSTVGKILSEVDCVSFLLAMLKDIPKVGNLVNKTVDLLNKTYGLRVQTEHRIPPSMHGPIFPLQKTPEVIAENFVEELKTKNIIIDSNQIKKDVSAVDKKTELPIIFGPSRHSKGQYISYTTTTYRFF